ncbi:MAG TPA: ABC transporter permease, partial [Bacteroidota bacterium]|nr:ABC transporter permease [Bacteroidota bacterium]
TFMVLRMPIQMPATWEFLVTIPLLIVSVVVMMWVAGKVFRVAILSYGKRPSIRELVRWVRES